MFEGFAEVLAPEANAEVAARVVEDAAWNDHDTLLRKRLLAEIIDIARSQPFWKGDRAGLWSVPFDQPAVFAKELFGETEVATDDLEVAGYDLRGVL